MSTLGKLATLSVLLVLIALGTGAAYTDAVETTAVTNESITVDYSASTPVDATGEAVAFNSTVTVFNDSAVELVNETDYTWHPSNGTVTWNDTGNTINGETATISYEYDAHTDETESVAAVLRTGLWVSGVGLLLFGGFAVLGQLDLIPGGGR